LIFLPIPILSQINSDNLVSYEQENL
jgi:hypothetical protein